MSYTLEKAARLLEWPRVLERLAELATSEPGRRLCRELPLRDDPEALRRAQDEVSQARELLERDVRVDLSPLVDLGAIAKRARVGSALEGGDLRLVAGILQLSRRTKRVLEGETERLPLLAQRANLLVERVVLEKEIFARIEPDGHVADNASPELRELRDRYRAVHDRIHATLERMVVAPEYDDILQDRFFSLRNGRFVLPVKSERRGAVEGIVHDISQTGQSLFIEPRAITELNNRLRTAELEIEREIYRILLELTYKVGAFIDELEATVAALGALDVVFAKARQSMALRAHPVEIARSGRVWLPAARHPLLVEQLENVIPNDIEMDNLHTLVVSGPNTGGKTVLLKTLGLAALMVRAGMHVPCGSDARLPVFKRVFAVIGDEQSLEQSLSSFSSHLLNLKQIVDELVPGCLVLIDEIGEGTDPAEGIALAKAILERLHEGGARTCVTTHFSQLMAEAQVREGWGNAAMAFDEAHNAPTYRLIAGAPGRSSAFSTAVRLGLDPALVERARQLATGADNQLERVIRELEAERTKLVAATERVREAEEKAAAEAERQKQLRLEMSQKKARLMQEETAKIRQRFYDAQAIIKQTIRDLQAKPTFDTAQTARTELRKLEREVAAEAPAPAERALPDDLEPIEDWTAIESGAMVFVRDVGEEGALLEGPDSRDRVKVQVRDKRLTVPAGRCFTRIDGGVKVRPVPRGGTFTLGADDEENVTRLDLRGQTADDAEIETERFLDQAMRLRLASVTIVHGHGTGVLKRAVREYLKKSPYAKQWRPGERGEGGDGATIVDLDL